MHGPVLCRHARSRGLCPALARLRRRSKPSGQKRPNVSHSAFQNHYLFSCFHFLHCSPAYCGATKGQTETLRLLLQHGADVWLPNSKGDVPLHEAVASGRKDLVLWLLRQWGQNEETQRHQRASSASITLERHANGTNNQETVVNGAAQVVNTDGRSPLHVAAINNNVEMCKVSLFYFVFIALFYWLIAMLRNDSDILDQA